MLSDLEKSKIELEEQYRVEVNTKFKSKPKIDIIEKMSKILQGLAIVIGIWVTYNEYRKQNEERLAQEKDRYEQTAKEFRKYFYQMQLDLYSEAAEATATLATESIGSPDYQVARKKFFRLFWGKLSIVEDKSVEARMIQFEKLLEQYEGDKSSVSQYDLKQASLRLAHDASHYMINVWIDEKERSNFNR